MEQYVGLDVSLKETSICVVDGSGEIVCETSVGTTPETIAKFIEKRAPLTVRVGLESGLLSTWLWHGLRALDVPVVCLDARHAASALSMQVNNATTRWSCPAHFQGIVPRQLLVQDNERWLVRLEDAQR